MMFNQRDTFQAAKPADDLQHPANIPLYRRIPDYMADVQLLIRVNPIITTNVIRKAFIKKPQYFIAILESADKRSE